MYQELGDTLVVMHRTMSIRPVLYLVLIALAFLVRAEGFVVTAVRADESSEAIYPGRYAANCKPAPIVGCVCDTDSAGQMSQQLQSTSKAEAQNRRTQDIEYLRMIEWLRLTCTAVTRSRSLR